MEVKGKVKIVGAEQKFGAKGFRKRELVVTTDEQYPQMIMIEFTQDKCDLLDDVKVGQEVTVSVNLRGREWINPEGNAKYFNSIQGWRVEVSETVKVEPVQEAPSDLDNEVNNDDLPF